MAAARKVAGYSTPKDVARSCLAALKRVQCIKYGPQRFDGWMTVVQNSGKAHRYGIYEEKFFPRAYAHPKDQGPIEMRKNKFGMKERASTCAGR